MGPVDNVQGLRRERIEASAQFHKGRFRNTSGAGAGLKREHTLSAVNEYVFARKARTPPAPLPLFDPGAHWSRAPETGLRVTWLGHSALVLEIDGARVLTDPMLGLRASPVGFAGPRRFQPPAVEASGLPKLDAVLISHDHYDHLDRGSILALALLEVPFITSLGVGAHLESWGIPPERIVELDWWEKTRIPRTDVVITATPSQHFSGRGIADRNHTLWSSFVLEGPHHKIFFGADTGLTREYADIGARFGPFDLSMIEIGAYHPAWSDIHLGPEGALQALAMLGGGPLLPVHWGTFDLATHGWDEPPEQLLARGTEQGIKLVMPPMGQPVEPVRVDGVEPWWRQI